METAVMLQIDLSKDLELYDWLKALMQNPIYEDESKEEQMFREQMFNALNVVAPKKTNPVREIIRKEREKNATEAQMWMDDDIPF